MRLLSTLIGFAAGTVFGLYYAQNYITPDIKKELERYQKQASEWQNTLAWKDPKKKP
jgi:hypothetical protein